MCRCTSPRRATCARVATWSRWRWRASTRPPPVTRWRWRWCATCSSCRTLTPSQNPSRPERFSRGSSAAPPWPTGWAPRTMPRAAAAGATRRRKTPCRTSSGNRARSVTAACGWAGSKRRASTSTPARAGTGATHATRPGASPGPTCPPRMPPRPQPGTGAMRATPPGNPPGATHRRKTPPRAWRTTRASTWRATGSRPGAIRPPKTLRERCPGTGPTRCGRNTSCSYRRCRSSPARRPATRRRRAMGCRCPCAMPTRRLRALPWRLRWCAPRSAPTAAITASGEPAS